MQTDYRETVRKINAKLGHLEEKHQRLQKVPFIYYVSTFRGGGAKWQFLLTFSTLFMLIKGKGVNKRNSCLLSQPYLLSNGGEGVKKSWKCAYVIYEWSLRAYMASRSHGSLPAVVVVNTDRRSYQEKSNYFRPLCMLK